MKIAQFKNCNTRSLSVNRLQAFNHQYRFDNEILLPQVALERGNGIFDKFVIYAGYQISSRSFILICVISSLLIFILGNFLSIVLGMILCPLGFYLPIAFAQSKAKERSKKFSEEYPSVLLAMASNMKAGLTVYSSLERAALLLPEESEVKKEVNFFLARITKGVPKDQAVEKFGETIELPELELFRRAFALVIVHGGKFSRTLERLAQVCRDRENLIKASRVSTASMRMTANVLLVIAPCLVFMLSVKNKDFWNTMFTNQTAFALSLGGATIIGLSVLLLRRMSDFKP